MNRSMIEILRGLAAATVLLGAGSAMAGDDGTCRNDPVSNDSCYQLLVKAKRECVNNVFSSVQHRNLDVRLQCQQLDGMGRCVKAQYHCVREGRVEHYGIVMGVRG